MIFEVIFCFLLAGAFGAETELVNPVMAGDSVTFRASLSEFRGEDQIFWYQVYGSDKVKIAYRRGNDGTFYDGVSGLKDRLKMDNTTGDLTIINTTTKDSGLYVLQMFIQGKESNKTFNVTVRDHLPVPVIIWDCPQNQSAGFSKTKCVAMCSVNVSDGTLSWYRNNDSVSSISLSDHPAVFSLSQEVDCPENNTYMCIVSNLFTNQTKHLNITDLCHHSEPKDFGLYKAVLVAVGAVVAVGLLLVVCCCKDVDKQNKRVLRKIWS